MAKKQEYAIEMYGTYNSEDVTLISGIIEGCKYRIRIQRSDFGIGHVCWYENRIFDYRR
ncbi:MAG: hypothetical protein ACJAR9_000007 [Celeribacter sp.]|jgi:hypothetical protein